ncbi:ADP-ribosylation factor-directed GTPase activating protein isoform b [Anatilimnocola aggregata]|uniref:ADP-ribosylation factor-directed GTPase activating protein isoform b n=1 Tax=Anatilimnocola aggregata TaxID=2528021 RepID=UPI00119CC755|nr:ADP-ribosylation factor-directed GTPase activating protein isoform b [Anatilimnocola aggregata]
MQTNRPVIDESGAPKKLELTDAELKKQIDDALDYTYENRRLDLKDQAAWQMIHGALAFKRDFLVRDGDKDVSALTHVLNGGKMKGWNLVRGDLLNEETKQYGVRALLEEGTKAGQGHTDQWLGYLCDCGMPLDEAVMVEGEQQTLNDWILQAERDVHRNPAKEYSWTLMALSAYRKPGYTWMAADGSEWSIEKLAEIELGYSLDQSPCGGAHRMFGLVMARDRHVAAGGKLEGVWADVDQKIKDTIAKAKELQNPDGSLSSNYFQRQGMSADLAQAMGSAGHCMEFLAAAMTKEELQEPWVRRAVGSVCSVFRKTKAVDVECGALFHAAHGLRLYRFKVFGPRTFPATGEEVKTAAAN